MNYYIVFFAFFGVGLCVAKFQKNKQKSAPKLLSEDKKEMLRYYFLLKEERKNNGGKGAGKRW